MIRIRPLPAVLLLLVCCAIACSSEDTPIAPGTTATLRGVVHVQPTGPLIAGASVVVGTRSTTTGDDGTFSFTDLPPGVTNITLVKQGYKSQTVQVKLTLGDNFLNLAMEPTTP